jgi:ParB-like chromosome segregation protein Spo0J
MTTLPPKPLVAHPFANEQRMMNEREFETLKASIKTDGLIRPIELYESKILDGRNRYKAALAVEYKFRISDFVIFVGTNEQAWTRANADNVARRHLTDDDKKILVRRMLEEHPERSNRKIAQLCGVSHPTVAKLREPEGDPALDKFARDWDGLSDQQRERFVERSSSELRELLG